MVHFVGLYCIITFRELDWSGKEAFLALLSHYTVIHLKGLKKAINYLNIHLGTNSSRLPP